MNSSKKILICGAGIAGPACAHWLHRQGHQVVVVEKARSFRDGGQNIDIKGAGQRVLQRMGLEDAVLARNTRECGQRWLDERGRLFAEFPRGSVGGLTSDFEILRGDFARLLFDSTRAHCEYRFGRSVLALEDLDDGVRVTFDDGGTETFELVICADGMHSSTRALRLAGQTRMRDLGAHMAFFNIPRRAQDDLWARSVNGIGGTMIFLRPGGEAVTTVLITFPNPPSDPKETGGATGRSPKTLLRAALVGRGSIADRLLEELDAVEDLYFGPMSQVQASTWSQGRMVLLGDAAHCPTPFTGKGTALALVGAYVLAGELHRCATHEEAFRSYEAMLRPYAERTQQELSPRFIRLMHLKSSWGIAMARGALRLLASAPVQRLLQRGADRRARDVEEDFALPPG
ncbi:FAD-dependent monooxygenase [Mitsuaria sp. GD03876]|uniref:FAD-dependent monooxygenase n=1 Tax=Mitsuaria sp. GD03876 TaxID=2975399 RepID=UPI0024496E32|nr:FAD-dependent monooxygenase [Mitsuaria sp. GD03876]MDH0867645.1 FAD-dependent monooxygenase [Mitsuaria sp. GD03876]